MCDQVPTPGRRHVADGWSMVRSQLWLIGYTFHHQKSYVVPTLGKSYQPNGWVAHIGPTWGELRRSTNHADHVPTLDQRLVADWEGCCLTVYVYLRYVHVHKQGCCLTVYVYLRYVHVHKQGCCLTIYVYLRYVHVHKQGCCLTVYVYLWYVHVHKQRCCLTVCLPTVRTCT
jgi:hypothetical protein